MANQLGGFRMSASLRSQHTQEMQGIHMMWIAPQRPPIQALRLVQPPPPMRLHGLRQDFGRIRTGTGRAGGGPALFAIH